MIVLDTDCLSIIDRRSGDAYSRLSQRLAQFAPDEVATTVITFEEQTRGRLAYLSKARSPQERILGYEKLQLMLDYYCEIPVLPFDQAANDEYERLKSFRLRTGTMDLKIAAIAVARNLLLVSRNLKDFEQVPNLRAEDWTK